jgi:hypothetical protein
MKMQAIFHSSYPSLGKKINFPGKISMITNVRTSLPGRFFLILVLLMMGLGMMPVQEAFAATLTVTNTDDSGPGSLRQAIADAGPDDVISFDPSLAGATITLASDIFVTFDGVTEKKFSIDGSGLSSQVTISGGDIAHLKFSSYTDVTISDLTITHGYGSGIESLGKLTILNSTLRDNNSGGAINSSGQLTLKNSTITQNQSIDGGGILIAGAGANQIINSTVTRNSASNNGGGIAIRGNAFVAIYNSTFAGNSSPQGAEIDHTGTSGLSATNTIFACAPENTNCYQYSNAGLTNSILGVGTLYDYGLAALADNGGPTQTMALLPGSPLIDAGNDASCEATDQRGITRPKGSHCDIGAYEYQAIVRYVKQGAGGLNDGSSWANAYTDLQSALAATFPDEEIWVAAGTYKPTTGGDRSISFNLHNGVALYGGFAGGETSLAQRNPTTHPTILSGNIGTVGDNSDNSYHVVVGSGTNNSAILDGFTVTAGKTTQTISSTSYGGGMYSYYGSPTVMNVTFLDNYGQYGGGMYNGGDNSCNPVSNPGIAGTPVLRNVIFKNNLSSEGGGLFTENCIQTTLTNVVFDGNSASTAGGGSQDRNGYISFTNVAFKNNTAGAGGGTQNLGSELSMTNVTFSGNSAVFGGAMVNGAANPTLNNVTFYGNSAEQGGGIWNSDSKPVLTNVTFYNNSASAFGGGIFSDADYSQGGSQATLQNAILWGNTAPTGTQIYNSAGSVASVSDSVVEGGFPGGTNLITTDPLLGTPGSYGGFTDTIPLQAGSSAIDSGSDANCPATDQRGVTRPKGSHCDIGAYEYEDLTPPTVLSIAAVDPNPTSASTVNFTVTFSEDVINVDSGDFSLAATGVTGASITGVTGSGASYTVTVNTGSGNGMIRLDLLDDDSIQDLANLPLGGVGTGNGDFTSGDTYTIQSITIAGNAGVAGVTLSYTDGSLKTATTDGSGNYSFLVSYNWSGTVTPSKTGFTFSPGSKSYSNLTSNKTTEDYTATAITYTISGNAGAADVTLSYTDGSPKTATTDGSGNYSFGVSYNWSGIVTPSKTGYTFTPTSKSYTNVTADQAAQNYTATPIIYTISGNAGVGGVTLSYTDGSAKTAAADSNGNYSFSVSYAWSGTVTPSKAGYTFTPTSKSYTNVTANQTAQNYTATPITYIISGNAGVGGVTLSYTDGSAKTATADGSGNYAFTVSYNWSGTVTPSKTGYTFLPASKTYSGVLADQTQNYTATPITYTISGNAGTSGVTLSYTDGSPKTATSDGSGNYAFTVSYNWSGIVTPSKTGFTFSPVNRTYTNVLSNRTAQNYTIPAPSASFDAWPTIINVGSTTEFHIVSTLNTSNCTWDYGDGTQNTGPCVSYHTHLYANPGGYTITLTATGPGGSNSMTRTQYITVYSTLVVSKTGDGSGTVTSSPAGINCGSTCSGSFAYQTTVTLTAVAAPGSNFIGWSGGGCSGTDPCTVTLNTAVTVSAYFEKIVANCPSITNWRGEYWVNPSLSGTPVLCRNDASVDFDWYIGSPDSLIPVDNFSAQWTKTVNLSGGLYQFFIDHDDGARLYIDDMVLPVLDKWDTSVVVDSTDPIVLSEGNHVIRMQYYEGGGAANARLWWVKLNPAVISMTRTDPDPSGASSVHFNVSFSENVTKVDLLDFSLTTSGITGALVTGVSGSGTTRIVTVNTGRGNGTLRLNLVDDDSIVNGSGIPLGGVGKNNGNYNTGQVYTIQKGTTSADVTVSVGSSELGHYGIATSNSERKSYNDQNNGPVNILNLAGTSVLASQRVIYGGGSYSEMMGLPKELLTKEYLFPYYNNVAMDSQLRVSNVGGADTTITVYLAGNQIDQYTLAAGGATRKNYTGKNSGPLRVISSASNILATVRVLYSGNSYSELMGLPVEQLAKEYLFPYYNNVAMDSQLRVSNVGGSSTTIKVFLGSSSTPIDSYTLAAGGATRKNYTGKNSGPLRITSSASNILATVRVLYSENSYSELMGFPAGQLSQSYWYPVYDNVAVDSQLRVSNVGSATTHITVYAGGSPIDSFDLGRGGAVRKNYSKNTGPLQVISSSQPILTTIRLLYGSSYYEMTGLPDGQLSTQYFFPWYNNKAMDSEIRLAVP